MNRLVLFTVLLALTACNTAEQQSISTTETPAPWWQDAIWYQIFAERFYNGNPLNDPTPQQVNDYFLSDTVSADWQIMPWTSNWYSTPEWAKSQGLDLRQSVYKRRYGGDLEGVLKKLDYLADLGITAIYFNPLNDAPSLHKYDARNYHHIDVNFGANPERDEAMMKSENPEDPTTWQWTSADSLFLAVIKGAHQRNIKVVLDYSWNHTGTSFWAWLDVVKNQGDSKYKDWYAIDAFDDPTTPQNEFKYHGWLGVPSLPELKKVDIVGERKAGFAYDGNIHPEVKKHIYDVTARWLKPNGEAENGVDGFRLDVADHIGLSFWRDYRQFVDSIKPETYLVGEIWWERWPETFMNPRTYMQGDMFDAVMFYHVFRPARMFFAKPAQSIDAFQLQDSLKLHHSGYTLNALKGMMLTASTHDSPRLLSSFANANKYKFHANPIEDKLYNTGLPNEETHKRLQLYLAHVFTSIGSPHIYNGEEMGMWGADDPDCRKPLIWPEFNFEPESKSFYTADEPPYDQPRFNEAHFNFYKQLIAIRKAHPALVHGEVNFVSQHAELLAYERIYKESNLLILLNNSSTAALTHELGGDYISVISNKPIKNEARLEPLTFDILKKQ